MPHHYFLFLFFPRCVFLSSVCPLRVFVWCVSFGVCVCVYVYIYIVCKLYVCLMYGVCVCVE